MSDAQGLTCATVSGPDITSAVRFYWTAQLIHIVALSSFFFFYSPFVSISYGVVHPVALSFPFAEPRFFFGAKRYRREEPKKHVCVPLPHLFVGQLLYLASGYWTKRLSTVTPLPPN